MLHAVGMLGRMALFGGIVGIISLLQGAEAALWGKSSAELEERLSVLCAKLTANGPLPNAAYREACEGFIHEDNDAEISWFVTLLFYGGTALLVFFASTFLRFVEPTHGRVLKYHVIYLACMVALLFVAPARYQEWIFSPPGLTVVGVLYPTLESVHAVLSSGGDDDTRWLQYWITQGVFTMCTAWLDSLAYYFPSLFEWWWVASFIFLLWLQLPYTDGSALLYETLTKPYIVPVIQPVAEKVLESSFVTNMISWVVNGAHIIILYFVFILLPGHVGQFVCIMLATVYPIMASIVAVTTEDTADDTQWLMYWSVFSVFHLVSNMVRDIVIWIPGFYSVMTLTVAFLLLPMTRGAETIFRKVLVPICQLEEKLLDMDKERLMKEAKRLGKDITMSEAAAEPVPEKEKKAE